MYFFSLVLNNGEMKTINDIHRENLQLLVEEFEGATSVANKIGCSPSQFSQWANASENSGTGKPRGMSAASARRIEKACEKPVGWMDVDHKKDALRPETSPDSLQQAHMVLAWPIEETLLDLYRRSDERGQLEIIATARGEAGRTAGQSSNQG
jgi:hypothetical protein